MPPPLTESNQGGLPMPHHAHSIDRWDDATGSNLYEHLAGVNDLLHAGHAFAAAVKRWPGAKITLRNGARDHRKDLAGGRLIALPWCSRAALPQHAPVLTRTSSGEPLLHWRTPRGVAATRPTFQPPYSPLARTNPDTTQAASSPSTKVTNGGSSAYGAYSLIVAVVMLSF